jgi:hypothetical protein
MNILRFSKWTSTYVGYCEGLRIFFPEPNLMESRKGLILSDRGLNDFPSLLGGVKKM